MKWGETSVIEGTGLCRSHDPLPPPQLPCPERLGSGSVSERGGCGVLTQMIQMKKFHTIDGLVHPPEALGYRR